MKKTGPKSKRVQRTVKGMLKTLQSQTELLRDYYYKAFVEKKTYYLGEVAGKLRLLVIDEGSNKALLIRLMEKFNDEILITLKGPPFKPHPSKFKNGDKISIPEFLNLESSFNYEVTKNENKNSEIITKRKLIKKWSEQFGSAHQDWSIDDDFYRFLKPQFYVCGIPFQGYELKETAKAILHVCEQFLLKHTKELDGNITIHEKWNELLTIKGISKLDDENSKGYTFWMDDHESLRNKEETTIVWFKEQESIFRLKKEKNVQLVFEQIYPASMKRQCSLNLDKIRKEPRYFFNLIWNQEELKLFVWFEDGTNVNSDE